MLEETKAMLRRYQLKPHVRRTALRRVYETELLFVHVPKCGGKTVIRDLYRLEDTRWFGHASIRRLRNLLGPRRFARVHKVGFVRDPVDRCLSGYRFSMTGGFQRANGLKAQAIVKDLSFDAFVQDGHLEEFISWNVVFRPQTLFLCDEQGKVAIDQICRFSNFEAELKGLMSRLYSDIDISHRNKSSAPKPTQVSEATKAAIREIYKDDYDTFATYF